MNFSYLPLLCISGGRVRRYIRNVYGSVLMTDSAEIDISPPREELLKLLELFRTSRLTAFEEPREPESA